MTDDLYSHLVREHYSMLSSHSGSSTDRIIFWKQTIRPGGKIKCPTCRSEFCWPETDNPDAKSAVKERTKFIKSIESHEDNCGNEDGSSGKKGSTNKGRKVKKGLEKQAQRGGLRN